MQFSSILVAALAAVVSAAPQYPRINTKDHAYPSDAMNSLSAYFKALADNVQAVKNMETPPVCDLSRAHMPEGKLPLQSIPSYTLHHTKVYCAAPEGLPAPSAGLKVRHVAVGRGTQNYTCDAGNATAAPVLAGAVATLFNASCVASLYPNMLGSISSMAIHFNLTENPSLGPDTLPVSGKHYFTSEGVPFFDLRTPELDIGEAPCAKNSSTPAPAQAALGQLGETAVPWLKLTTVDGATGNIKEVYRVTTSGGSAPASCGSMAATFEVEYSAV